MLKFVQILSTKTVKFGGGANYLYRHIRSIAPRDDVPRRIKAKVKTVTEFQEEKFQPHFESYEDFVRHLKQTKTGDELEVEKEFLQNDYYGDVPERCDMYFDMHSKEEERLKRNIKRNIIERKYFKLEKETNLLTHAAKEQIRYLHKSNPLEWNCKSLSECFPISEAGVKKLLKCDFVLKGPEKIKLHDENVARKWQLLKSGKPTNEIYPLTKKLYKEGKLIDDYFSGNPNLPAVSASAKKVIEIKKKERIGEFSAIVKTYVEYQKQKLLASGKENSNEKQISLKDSTIRKIKTRKDIRQFRCADDLDDDDAPPEVRDIPRKRYNYADDDIAFSNFKESLKEETNLKLKSKRKYEYDDFVMEEISEKNKSTSYFASQQSLTDQNYFTRIQKYQNEKLDLTYEKNNNTYSAYKYDEKLGYLHPIGKTIKGKIRVTKSRGEKKLHKIGENVYDENGEFLYRVP